MTMKTFTRRDALALMATTAVASCFSTRPEETTGPGDDVEVLMTPELVFSPATVEIDVGQAVLWRNTSAFAHTSTADVSIADDPSHVQLPSGAQPWHSGLVPAGGTFRRTFDVPGTYRYFCQPHEAQEMVGTIIVS
jgi:plastocyanin